MDRKYCEIAGCDLHCYSRFTWCGRLPENFRTGWATDSFGQAAIHDLALSYARQAQTLKSFKGHRRLRLRQKDVRLATSFRERRPTTFSSLIPQHLGTCFFYSNQDIFDLTDNSAHNTATREGGRKRCYHWPDCFWATRPNKIWLHNSSVMSNQMVCTFEISYCPNDTNCIIRLGRKSFRISKWLRRSKDYLIPKRLSETCNPE